MKRIIQVVVVGALCSAGQVKADDWAIVLPAKWTHADNLPATGVQASAFPSSAEEMIVLVSPSASFVPALDGPIASAFPSSARDPIVVESKSTYADRSVTERSVHARGAYDPALSQ